MENNINNTEGAMMEYDKIKNSAKIINDCSWDLIVKEFNKTSFSKLLTKQEMEDGFIEAQKDTLSWLKNIS